jgi:hypothetical protein
MFKSVRNYFKNRRERKIRERLALKIACNENEIERFYQFILTGHLPYSPGNPISVKIAL